MNKQTKIGTIFTVAAAAGISAGVLIHNLDGAPAAQATQTSNGVSGTASSQPPVSPTTTLTTAPKTPATTTKAQTVTPNPAPSAANLLVPADFTGSGVANMKIDATRSGGPEHDMSFCPAVDGPIGVEARGRAVNRTMTNPDGQVRSYQLLVDFTSVADADAHVRFLQDWHDHCGTPSPTDPSQNFVVGATHTETVPGSDRSIWWDTTFVNDGKQLMETVAYTRTGTRVSVVVFSGSVSAIKNTDMTPLVGHMADRMS